MTKKAFDKIVAGMEDALAFAKGEANSDVEAMARALARMSHDPFGAATLALRCARELGYEKAHATAERCAEIAETTNVTEGDPWNNGYVAACEVNADQIRAAFPPPRCKAS